MTQEQQPAQSNEHYQELELETFRREIEAIGKQEAKEGKTSHFTDLLTKERVRFDPEELNEADLEIWRKTERGDITEDDFHAYRRQFLQPPLSQSRQAFESLLTNRVMAVLLERELKNNSQ